MNDHRRGNGIRAYRSCVILLLLLIMALTPSAAATDITACTVISPYVADILYKD